MLPGGRAADVVWRVLYVDDNEVNLRVVAALMEVLGIAASCCSSGRSALDLLRREAFVAVFTDIQMPEVSGIDLLRELRRRSGPNRTAPVVAVSADLTRNPAEYAALGFEGFLAKPIGLRSLAETLLRCLSAKERLSVA